MTMYIHQYLRAVTKTIYTHTHVYIHAFSFLQNSFIHSAACRLSRCKCAYSPLKSGCYHLSSCTVNRFALLACSTISLYTIYNSSHLPGIDFPMKLKLTHKTIFFFCKPPTSVHLIHN